MNGRERNASTASRLREAMQAAGKKQADLVRETGLDRGSISSYLSGKYEPKQTAINKLALALNVSEMWLWGYDAPRERTMEQKKNDQLAQLVVRMRREPEFYSIITKLNQVPKEQLENIDGLLTGLLK